VEDVRRRDDETKKNKCQRTRWAPQNAHGKTLKRGKSGGGIDKEVKTPAKREMGTKKERRTETKKKKKLKQGHTKNEPGASGMKNAKKKSLQNLGDRENVSKEEGRRGKKKTSGRKRDKGNSVIE